MTTIAYEVLDYLDRHPETSDTDKLRLLEQVPAWQWAVAGGHWHDLARHCCNRVEVPVERRPGNALNIEIGTPAARCLYRPPDGRGVTRDGGTLDWLNSGGSILAYGICEQAECERAKR